MKKTVLILAVLLCSMAFSASVLAENDEVAATSSGKTVRMAGGTPGGADWGYPSPFHSTEYHLQNRVIVVYRQSEISSNYSDHIIDVLL